MDLDGWEGSVVRAISAINLNRVASGGDTDWTKEVLKALCTAGREFGFYTCSAKWEHTGANSEEWLWDCTWLDYHEDGVNPLIRFVPMVAECEWQTGAEIYKDFDKLLVATAPLRVFVYSAGRGEPATAQDRARNRAGKLLDRVRAIEVAAPREVRYLLLAREWSDRPRFWHFKIELDRPSAPNSWELFDI